MVGAFFAVSKGHSTWQFPLTLYGILFILTFSTKIFGMTLGGQKKSEMKQNTPEASGRTRIKFFALQFV